MKNLFHKCIDFIFQSRGDKRGLKNNQSIADYTIASFLEDIVDDDKWLETYTRDSTYDEALKKDYDSVAHFISEIYKEIEEHISKKSADEEVFSYDASATSRYFVLLKSELIGMIADFFHYMKVPYEVNPELGDEEDELIDAAEEEIKDAAEYAKDPYDYYGVSRSDFF